MNELLSKDLASYKMHTSCQILWQNTKCHQGGGVLVLIQDYTETLTDSTLLLTAINEWVYKLLKYKIINRNKK